MAVRQTLNDRQRRIALCGVVAAFVIGLFPPHTSHTVLTRPLDELRSTDLDYHFRFVGAGSQPVAVGLLAIEFLLCAAVVAVLLVKTRDRLPKPRSFELRLKQRTGSLVPCPDCGRSLSPRAVFCPQCGRPFV
ncbi:MAG: zinc-ribbon domain-containing protein [Pirellulales bacterium]